MENYLISTNSHNKAIKLMGESTNVESAFGLLISRTAPTAYGSR